MGKINDIMLPAYDLVQTESPGEFLLDQVKVKMLEQSVFRELFGSDGKNIWINEEKSLNDSAVPCIQFKYTADTYGNRDTLLTGSISVVVIFPEILTGRTDVFRKFCLLFQRWLGSNTGIFEAVPGLTMLGQNSAYQYDRLAAYSGSAYPCATFTLPYRIDMVIFNRMMPEVDLTAHLDADPFQFVRSYTLAIQNEESKQILTSTKTIIPRGSNDQ